MFQSSKVGEEEQPNRRKGKEKKKKESHVQLKSACRFHPKRTQTGFGQRTYPKCPIGVDGKVGASANCSESTIHSEGFCSDSSGGSEQRAGTEPRT